MAKGVKDGLQRAQHTTDYVQQEQLDNGWADAPLHFGHRGGCASSRLDHGFQIPSREAGDLIMASFLQFLALLVAKKCLKNDGK